jgi:hypothetical protein
VPASVQGLVSRLTDGERNACSAKLRPMSGRIASIGMAVVLFGCGGQELVNEPLDSAEDASVEDASGATDATDANPYCDARIEQSGLPASLGQDRFG